MAQMSRMNKYKELRESIKKEVVTEEKTFSYEPEVKQEETVKIEQPVSITDDTLIEQLTVEQVNNNVSPEVKRVLNKVREETNQEDDYDTRMDILNKLRQSKLQQEAFNAYIEEEQGETEEESVEELVEEPVEKIFDTKVFDEKIIPETESEVEMPAIFKEPEVEEEEKKSKFNFFKNKEDEAEFEDLLDEDEEENNSVFIKVLNVIIVILALVLVGLLGYIAKEFIF